MKFIQKCLIMLAKIGGFLYRARVAALGIGLAIVIGAAIFGIGVFSSLSSGGYGTDNSESAKAAQLLKTKLGGSSVDVIILLRSNTLKATDANFTQAATSLLLLSYTTH